MTSVASVRARDHAVASYAVAGNPRPWGLLLATAGDHPAVDQLLRTVGQPLSAAEFQAQLDEPGYEPRHRVLVKSEGRVVAHLRVIPREQRWAEQCLPVAWLADLAILPECRGLGCATALLRAAEHRLQHDGGVLGLVRTEHPSFYRQHGWTVCGQHSYTVAGAREILACLAAPPPGRLPWLASAPPPLHLRYWRRVEQAALPRLYEEHTHGLSGICVRSPARWRWLIGRKAYDQIYVAIEGSPELALDDTQAPIVGYAVAKLGRIVELMTSRLRPEAARELLARVCRDTIESNRQDIRFEAPPEHPLHAVLVAAGGRHLVGERDQGWTFMAKIFDLPELLQRLGPALRSRARAGRLPLPVSLGLWLENEPWQLEVTARRVRLHRRKLGRSYWKGSLETFTQRVLGHCGPGAEFGGAGREASTRAAFATARALFPEQPLWYPPFDDLPS